MTSVSEEGTNLPKNQLLSNQPTNYHLSTVEEVNSIFHDNDPLLGNQSFINLQHYKKGSKPSSTVTSYKNETSDSGMSTENSSNFEKEVQRVPETDEKFVVREVSLQPIDASIQSGHNSIVSSCRKNQNLISNSEMLQQSNDSFNENIYKAQKAANINNNFQEKIQAKPELTGKFLLLKKS